MRSQGAEMGFQPTPQPHIFPRFQQASGALECCPNPSFYVCAGSLKDSYVDHASHVLGSGGKLGVLPEAAKRHEVHKAQRQQRHEAEQHD